MVSLSIFRRVEFIPRINTWNMKANIRLWKSVLLIDKIQFSVITFNNKIWNFLLADCCHEVHSAIADLVKEMQQGTVFKQSIAGLNSVFFFCFFYSVSCHTMAKSLVCLTVLLGGREKRWIYSFPKGISTMWNANSSIRYLNTGQWQSRRRKTLNSNQLYSLQKLT